MSILSHEGNNTWGILNNKIMNQTSRSSSKTIWTISPSCCCFWELFCFTFFTPSVINSLLQSKLKHIVETSHLCIVFCAKSPHAAHWIGLFSFKLSQENEQVYLIRSSERKRNSTELLFVLFVLVDFHSLENHFSFCRLWITCNTSYVEHGDALIYLKTS